MALTQQQAQAYLRNVPGAQHATEPGYEDNNVFSAASNWLNKKNAPQIGANPYQGQWDSLISQLTAQGNGQGQSLAGNAYKEAQQTGMQNVLAMSRGGSAGAARGGGQMLGKMNQGFNQGYSNALLQEKLAARQQLQMALAGAGNAWFQPQQMNMQAQMGTQTNGQQLMNFGTQLLSSFAPFATPSKPA